MSIYDAAVIGRGAIGSVAALAFARAGWRVALIGPRPAPGSAGGTRPAAAEEAPGWDQRVYALSPASRALLTELGIWQGLDPARIAPVHDMRIFHNRGKGAASPPEVHLDAYGGRVEALAWIVENRELQGAIDKAIAGALPSVKLSRVDAEVDGLTLPLTAEERRPASLDLVGGGKLAAHLVVAADGTSSRLRDLAGIDYVSRDYEQTAIVANFEADRPHRDCAWQWFGDFGVVALLPLPSDDLEYGRSRVSLVWSAPIGQAVRALAAGGTQGDQANPSLAGEIQTMTGNRLGSLRLITPPASFPLRTVRCRQVIKPSFVLIGDAAHAIHPMAGQGMNLGFGDVRGLMDHLLAQPRLSAASSRAPDWLALRRYERSRREPVATMQLAMDGLYRAFGDLPAPLVGLRDLGWSIVARSSWLRRRMIDHAVS